MGQSKNTKSLKKKNDKFVIECVMKLNNTSDENKSLKIFSVTGQSYTYYSKFELPYALTYSNVQFLFTSQTGDHYMFIVNTVVSRYDIPTLFNAQISIGTFSIEENTGLNIYFFQSNTYKLISVNITDVGVGDGIGTMIVENTFIVS